MQIKLIIWDLDDTLWHGTLADGEEVSLIESRAGFVRAFNKGGIVSSICSKNDRASAEAKLSALGLWEEFVFARIAFVPKPEAIRQIIEDMRLRPANVLFIDDNAQNLAGARHLLPEIHTLDANAPDADATLGALLAALPPKGRDRRNEYQMLERRALDLKDSATSNEHFLSQCDIRATAPFIMDNLDFLDRIVELVNRSNQLNYTASRVDADELASAIIDVAAHDSWSIFAWDRYGDYGLVGFVMIDRRARCPIHFTFSCRVMHMGLEQYALGKVLEKWPDCDLSLLAGRCAPTAVPWIRDMSFHDPEVRERLIAQLHPQVVEKREIRIMFDCQSGGIAHFSAFRDRIDFDNAPRMFALRHLIPRSGEEIRFTRHMVYGAGVDYSDPRWPNLADLLESGLFEACVELLCVNIAGSGTKLLVVLPPEDAPETFYRHGMGHTRERTILFNGIWRRLAQAQEGITLFELTRFAKAEDMADVSHYYAGFLQRLAVAVDRWLAATADAGDLSFPVPPVGILTGIKC